MIIFNPLEMPFIFICLEFMLSELWETLLIFVARLTAITENELILG